MKKRIRKKKEPTKIQKIWEKWEKRMSEQETEFDSVGRRKPKRRGRYDPGFMERRKNETIDAWLRREHDLHVNENRECKELLEQIREMEADLTHCEKTLKSYQTAAREEKKAHTKIAKEIKRLKAIRNTAVKRIYNGIEERIMATVRQELGIRHTWVDPHLKREIRRSGKNRTKKEGGKLPEWQQNQ